MDDLCRIQSASATDLPAIHAIEQRAFTDPWSRSALVPLFSDLALIAVSEGAVIGFAFARAAADEAEIVNLAVDPAYQRRGVARRLVQACLEQLGTVGARTVYLEVRAGNAAALGLYANAGFGEVGRRVRYYRNPPEDAVLLSRPLPPPEGVA